MNADRISLSENVLRHLGESTDRRQVRKDYLGNDYMNIAQVVTRLNLAFNYDWDWETVRFFEENNVMFCHGRLTCRLYDEDGNVHTIVKEAVGGAEINNKKRYGDIYKSAASYAMKKAASYLNIGLDLSMKEEERMFALENNARNYNAWSDEAMERHKDGWDFIGNLLDNEVMSSSDINAYVNSWSSGSYLTLEMIPEKEFDNFVSSLKAEFEAAQQEAKYGDVL